MSLVLRPEPRKQGRSVRPILPSDLAVRDQVPSRQLGKHNLYVSKTHPCASAYLQHTSHPDGVFDNLMIFSWDNMLLRMFIF
jgi:hypothetical protein